MANPAGFTSSTRSWLTSGWVIRMRAVTLPMTCPAGIPDTTSGTSVGVVSGGMASAMLMFGPVKVNVWLGWVVVWKLRPRTRSWMSDLIA